VELQLKSGKPLTRYFPELVAERGELPADRFCSTVRSLLQSRVRCRSIIYWCGFIRLRAGWRDWARRRRALTPFLIRGSTDKVDRALEGFRFGVGLDGVIAKRRDLPYQSGEWTGMKKIKKRADRRLRLAGFRYLEKKSLVGSLLLGLYYPDGELHRGGFTSSIQASERPALTKKLEKLVSLPGFTRQGSPGGPSRWSRRSGEWKPLAPKLVVEVGCDPFAGGRFRHGTKFLCWRPRKVA